MQLEKRQAKLRARLTAQGVEYVAGYGHQDKKTAASGNRLSTRWAANVDGCSAPAKVVITKLTRRLRLSLLPAHPLIPLRPLVAPTTTAARALLPLPERTPQRQSRPKRRGKRTHWLRSLRLKSRHAQHRLGFHSGCPTSWLKSKHSSPHYLFIMLLHFIF